MTDEEDLVAGRECGSCTVCCTVPTIDKPDIQKLAGASCVHRRGGCAIYDTRPQVCRGFHCAWRRLPIFDDSWRPDRSGVFSELEAVDGETGISLTLVGNPLKTVRQPWFVDFVATGVAGNLPLLLGLPGPRGHQGAQVLLNSKAMRLAASQGRAGVKALLEKALRQLAAHSFRPHVMINSGHDLSEP